MEKMNRQLLVREEKNNFFELFLLQVFFSRNVFLQLHYTLLRNEGKEKESGAIGKRERLKKRVLEER